MLHASTQRLIAKICELSANNEIPWRESENGRCAFETEGYVIEIAAAPPEVRLLQSSGKELERADEATLSATPWPGPEGGSFSVQVANMATAARRIANGTERAIDSILSSLTGNGLAWPGAAPPKAQTQTFSHDGGPESEAAMAAAVADMAERLKHNESAAPAPIATTSSDQPQEEGRERYEIIEEPTVASEASPAPALALAAAYEHQDYLVTPGSEIEPQPSSAAANGQFSPLSRPSVLSSSLLGSPSTPADAVLELPSGGTIAVMSPRNGGDHSTQPVSRAVTAPTKVTAAGLLLVGRPKQSFDIPAAPPIVKSAEAEDDAARPPVNNVYKPWG